MEGSIQRFGDAAMTSTDTIQDQNRLWTILAYGVVPATRGEWMLDSWLHDDDEHAGRITGMVVIALNESKRVVIETPEQYHEFLEAAGWVL